MARQNNQSDNQDRLWLSIIAAGGRSAERALEGLFRKYRRPLIAFMVQRRLDEGTAEELVQDTFLRLMRSASTYRNEAKVSSWIYQIARNMHVDHLRKANIEDTFDEDAWNSIEQTRPILDTGLAAQCVQQSLQDCFELAFSEFARSHPQPADILHKVVHLQWSSREISVFLSRTEGAAREYISQCRKKLKPFLEPCRPLLSDLE